MKTPEEWLNEIPWDKSVCTGHGEYDDLPPRLSTDIIRMIQEDALESQWTPLPIVSIQKTDAGTFVVSVDEVWIPRLL